jgi:hypothetical protein
MIDLKIDRAHLLSTDYEYIYIENMMREQVE